VGPSELDVARAVAMLIIIHVYNSFFEQ
jgi:hypothetical protein